MYTYMFLLKIDVISLPGQIAANQLCETTCPPGGVCFVVPRAGTW